jgi:serine/threonine-protein phosphatase 6 regulatory ankyrin repeat subunit B
MIASKGGHLDVVQFLLEAKADLEAKNKKGDTPLMVAGEGGHLDVIQFLLEAKANLEAKNKEGDTVLHFAIYCKKTNVVQYLIKEARANLETKNDRGYTPLFSAVGFHTVREIEGKEHGFENAGEEYLDVVRCLLEAKANVEESLHNSAYLGDLKMVELLIKEYHTDIDIRDHGHTPLMRAAQSGKLKTVQYLLEAKANLEAKSNSGATALSAAICQNQVEVVQYLVNEARANVETKDSFGMTPLMHASEKADEDVVKCLLDARADTEARSVNSWTAREIAIEEDRILVADMLEAVSAYVTYFELI